MSQLTFKTEAISKIGPDRISKKVSLIKAEGFIELHIRIREKSWSVTLFDDGEIEFSPSNTEATKTIILRAVLEFISGKE